MIKGRRIFGLLFFSCLAFKCFGYENSIIEINDQVINQLIDLGDSSILFVNNEQKIYFNSDKIIPHNDGLYLQTQSGEFYRIPFLMSNESGCFTVFSSSQINSTIYPIIKCKNCNKPFNPNIFNKGKCPHCGTQN
ncbi:MAG: hypothetical protein K940chlam6_00986 [Chlamydiae bacterium]|nr:hypothetical protein [Chlamydiota bacterium]